MEVLHSGAVNSRSYHSSEKPSGGNLNVLDAEKLMGMTTSVGTVRNSPMSTETILSQGRAFIGRHLPP